VSNEPPPDHLGHRKRLRQRFLAGGPTALADYELLELLLCPRISSHQRHRCSVSSSQEFRRGSELRIAARQGANAAGCPQNDAS